MTRSAKVLFGLSSALLILSYPTCQIGEKTRDKVVRYPSNIVEAFSYDVKYQKLIMIGVWMFWSGVLFALVAVFLWIVGRKTGSPGRPADATGYR